MWIFLRCGFYSVVQDKADPDILVVRARDRGHANAVASALMRLVVLTPDADYPFRVLDRRELVMAWISKEVESITYGNFKGEVAKQMHEPPLFDRYLGSLHEVWSVMRRWIDPRPIQVPGRLRSSAQAPRSTALEESVGRRVASGPKRVRGANRRQRGGS